MLVDSGCTTHIDRSGDNFIDFNPSFHPENHSIKLADGNIRKQIVKGSGRTRTSFLDEEGKSFNVKF